MSPSPRYLYKFLTAGARSPFTRAAWKKPTESESDGWMEAPLPLLSCDQGIHLCRPKDLAYWMNEELWCCEVTGELGEGVNCLLVQRARLVRRAEGWSPSFLANLISRFLAGLPLHLPEVSRYASAAGDLVAKKEMFAAAYAAAIAAGKAVRPEEEVQTFHAARNAQGEMISRELGLR